MVLSKSRQQKQQTLSKAQPIFRISKNKLNIQPASGKQKIEALEDLITPETQTILTPQPKSSKRRHNEVDSENEDASVMRRPLKSIRKMKTVDLPTPPASSPEPEILSQSLEELRSLHKAFTQALSVHYAHHGTQNGTSLDAILPAVTRLWKRKTVTQEDIERMLAVYELQEQSTESVNQKLSPWKLIKTGIGHSQHTKVERVGQANGGFLEQQLQQRYELLIESLQRTAQEGSKYNFVFGSISEFPRLQCEIGQQTQARKEKIDTIKSTVMKPVQTEPDFSKLNISCPSDVHAPVTREDRLKSRTLSLFDRLKAKQITNSALGAQPTSAEMLKRRALHRIPDIIDTLRMKQSQKLNSMFRSDFGMPSTSRNMSVKVSFSLEQLVQEIRDSGRAPVASEEIRECIIVLGRDVPDTWCTVYFGESMKCVTLQGEGWTKAQIKDWCREEIERMR